jgi:hypothetical protein
VSTLLGNEVHPLLKNVDGYFAGCGRVTFTPSHFTHKEKCLEEYMVNFPCEHYEGVWRSGAITPLMLTSALDGCE